jgi:hypothetical protein
MIASNLLAIYPNCMSRVSFIVDIPYFLIAFSTALAKHAKTNNAFQTAMVRHNICHNYMPKKSSYRKVLNSSC